MAALYAAAAVALTGCRQEMADQPYYRPLQASEFFERAAVMPDASARPLVDGTVFRGNLRDDAALFTGKLPGSDGKPQLVEEFPIDITAELIKRGHERFNINCAPCHGFTGDGDGMIVQRGLQGPINFHIDRMTTAPVGHYYDVVSNGFGRMFSMDHIPVRDRWAIIAYIRALQLSQNAALDDVPEADRVRLLAMPVTATTGTAVAAGPAPQPQTTFTGGVH